jgi:hypothetical protein
VKALKRVGIGAVVLASAALSLFALDEFGMCGVEIVDIVPSPDRQQQVVIYQYDCGATTDFSTQVTLNPLLASRPIGGGNIWSADADHYAAPRAKWGGPDVRIEWTSSTTLRLLHHPRARVFRAERRVGGVSIAYGLLGETDPTPKRPLERAGMNAPGPAGGASAGRSAPSR